MKSFLHLNKGRTPRQAHRDLGDLKDDELGRNAFYGRTAQWTVLDGGIEPLLTRGTFPLRIQSLK